MQSPLLHTDLTITPHDPAFESLMHQGLNSDSLAYFPARTGHVLMGG
jgi:hypothetical protein